MSELGVRRAKAALSQILCRRSGRDFIPRRHGRDL
jgi:hypothetical protein